MTSRVEQASTMTFEEKSRGAATTGVLQGVTTKPWGGQGGGESSGRSSGWASQTFLEPGPEQEEQAPLGLSPALALELEGRLSTATVRETSERGWKKNRDRIQRALRD